MIDAHTHLYLEEFNSDFDETIARANAAGVNAFIFPAIEKSAFEKMTSMQTQYPQKIFLATGLHPTSVHEETYQQELDFVEKSVKNFPFVAIGETGIDCYWTTENIALQRTIPLCPFVEIVEYMYIIVISVLWSVNLDPWNLVI